MAIKKTLVIDGPDGYDEYPWNEANARRDYDLDDDDVECLESDGVVWRGGTTAITIEYLDEYE